MSKKSTPRAEPSMPDTPPPKGGKFTESSTEAIECQITRLEDAQALPELISDVAHHCGRTTFAAGAIQRFKDTDGRTMVVVAFDGALAKSTATAA